MKKVANYTYLAPLYDKLMEDVDYESWADYIDEIIQEHHSAPEKILELACGTGSVALSLEEFGYYEIVATDLSEEMIAIAKSKASKVTSSVRFKTMDFLNIMPDEHFDVIFSVFDSVNYLKSEAEILSMLSGCHNILNDRGLLIFDFSTPKNSLQAVDYLNNEEAQVNNLRFFRTSEFDAQKKLHINKFEIELLDKDKKSVIKQFQEVHTQHIYTLEEMLSILEQTPYHLVAKYGDFDLLDANENSARITLVLQCQKPQ